MWRQAAAIIPALFALAGTILGVLGTLAVELTRTHADNIRTRREALLLACADFTSAVARTRNLAIELKNHPGDTDLLNSMREANREAREHFERLRLIAPSLSIQKAGRHVVRYTYGLLRQAEGKPPRDDEQQPGLLIILNDWLMTLRAEVRREIGIPQPEALYREPEEWVNPPD
jgi:hypothetical protein